ncbi:MAG: FAD-binding protein, partial [Coriobacteriaceae bacterium]|nr:FAD-binding protein [Coriobacteriaceae bacterium]
MDVTRRNFVAAAAVAGVAANAGIALAGETQTVVECDIAIVGAGGSGLAAAVEAAEAGVKVVVLERMPYAGGGGLGVEGIFAVNSSMQQA